MSLIALCRAMMNKVVDSPSSCLTPVGMSKGLLSVLLILTHAFEFSIVINAKLKSFGYICRSSMASVILERFTLSNACLKSIPTYK